MKECNNKPQCNIISCSAKPNRRIPPSLLPGNSIQQSGVQPSERMTSLSKACPGNPTYITGTMELRGPQLDSYYAERRQFLERH